MTAKELQEIEARQKEACPPDGSIKFRSDIIEKDVPKLIAEIRECWRVMMRAEMRTVGYEKYPLEAATEGCDCGGLDLDASGKTHKSWCAQRQVPRT